MIFLSLGTHEQPFARAPKALKPLVRIGQTVLVQYGCTTPQFGWSGFEWVEYLPYDEMSRRIEEADAFFCHAGVGSILSALMLGITPIVIPRLARLDEHVDNHQLQLTQKLVARGLVINGDTADVVATARRARGSRGEARGPNMSLLSAVRAAVG